MNNISTATPPKMIDFIICFSLYYLHYLYFTKETRDTNFDFGHCAHTSHLESLIFDDKTKTTLNNFNKIFPIIIIALQLLSQIISFWYLATK